MTRKFFDSFGAAKCRLLAQVLRSGLAFSQRCKTRAPSANGTSKPHRGFLTARKRSSFFGFDSSRGGQENRMHIGYSSDELKSLARILNTLLVEARDERPELSTDDVVQRVYALADRGERDATKLRHAVFGDPVKKSAFRR